MPPAGTGADAGLLYTRLAFGVVAIGVILRLYDLGGPSLWFDEIVYAFNSRGSLGEVLANTQHNNSSPLFLPLLLWVMDAIAGLGEFAARFPSAVFGVASIAVMLALPRVGVPRSAALGAAALLAVGQLQIYYAQEVREYSLSILVSAWILWAGLRASRDGKWGHLALAGAAAPWMAYGPCFAYLAVLGWLAFYKLLGRFPVAWSGLAAGVGAFFASAAIAYLVVAKHQLGLGQQYYLVEHYLAASGMNPVEWLAANTGGVLLASLPGLLGVLLGVAVMGAFIVRRIRQPLRLLEEPIVVLAAALIVGMALAGVLAIYPFGSPRHSVFMGPFIALAIGVAARDLILATTERRRRWAAWGVAASFAQAGVLGLAGITPGAGLHPAIAKVGAIRVYGEFQDNRALLAFARSHADKPIYAIVGASPAAKYYGAGLPIITGGLELVNRPGPQAEDILARARGPAVVVLLANTRDGEADGILAELERRGARVERAFADTRVEAFIVRRTPADAE